MSGANGSLMLNHMGPGSGDWYVRLMPSITNEGPLRLETRLARIIQLREVLIVSRNFVPIPKLFHPRHLAFWLVCSASFAHHQL